MKTPSVMGSDKQCVQVLQEFCVVVTHRLSGAEHCRSAASAEERRGAGLQCRWRVGWGQFPAAVTAEAPPQVYTCRYKGITHTNSQHAPNAATQQTE